MLLLDMSPANAYWVRNNNISSALPTDRNQPRVICIFVILSYEVDRTIGEAIIFFRLNGILKYLWKSFGPFPAPNQPI
jgi:hypothetical protein